MRTQIKKWGNSLALRIPRAFAKEIGAVKGTHVNMTIENDTLVIRVAKPKKCRCDLQKLIDGITEENRHPEMDWGPPVATKFSKSPA